MSEIIPIKTKKLRKTEYPTKRNNYRRYENSKWKWENVFNDIEILKSQNGNQYMKKISTKYNIPYSTLKMKYSNWKNENKCPNDDDRGGHNRIFSEDEEKNLYNYIVNIFIECNLVFNNDHLKFLTIQFYHALQKEKDQNYKADDNFTISDGWVCEYKQRWRLSSLKSKLSRRGTKINPEELNGFLIECKNISETVNKENIWNLDETFWRINTAYDKVIGFTNSDHRKVESIIDEKAGYTTIFTISAIGLFLKPTIIMKGKTDASLTKIKDISDNDVNKKYSCSGWINIDILLGILNNINIIAKGGKSALILDKYSVHTDDIIQKEAEKLNIRLIYVPTGKTSTNQPLDVSINGPIKSIGKTIANKVFLKDPFAEYTLVNSIKAMIEAKNKISKELIIKSFNIACNIN